MKMLTIVCREQFEDEVLNVFTTLGINGYTVIHGVGGSGETGAVSVTHTQGGRNKMLLVALDDDPDGHTRGSREGGAIEAGEGALGASGPFQGFPPTLRTRRVMRR